MLTRKATIEMIEKWKSIWNAYHERLSPNRKSGQELLNYLTEKYTLTEIYEKEAIDAIYMNVTMNEHLSAKLPPATLPQPRAFFLENSGNGTVFYKEENKDPYELWGGNISRIFVGIDLASGHFMIEGSTMLWDELYAFQGLDEMDLQNPYCVSEYIACLERFKLLQSVLDK